MAGIDASIPLSGIAPKLPSASDMVSLQAMMDQMRQRKLKSDQDTAQLGSEKAMEGLAAGVSAYMGAPPGTPEEQRMTLMKDTVREYFEKIGKSGQGRLYGWNDQKIQEFATHDIPIDRALSLIDQHAQYKDMAKRGMDLRAGMQEGKGIPLGSIGQQPEQEAPRPTPEGSFPPGMSQEDIDKKYEEMSKQPQAPVEIGKDEKGNPVAAASASADIEGKQQEEQPAETVKGLYERAKEREASAARLRKQGRYDLADKASGDAKDLRSAGAALETRQQKDRSLDQADAREERLAKAKEGQDIRPEDANRIAKQYLAGDRQAATGFARSQKNQAVIHEAITEEAKRQGKGGKDIAAIQAEYHGLIAEESALGRRSAGISTAIKSAQAIGPMVEEASRKVDRTRFPTLNRLLAEWKKGTGDEDVNNLAIAVNSFINVYARGINPSGQSTVSDKDHARELLSQYWAKGQITGGMKFLMKELEAESHAPGEVKQDVRKEFLEGQQAKPKPKTYYKEDKAKPIEEGKDDDESERKELERLRKKYKP